MGFFDRNRKALADRGIDPDRLPPGQYYTERFPVLHVGGTESGSWFAEVRELVLEWLPEAEDVVIAGAGHSLALTHTAEVADAVSDFLARHPIDGGGAAQR